MARDALKQTHANKRNKELFTRFTISASSNRNLCNMRVDEEFGERIRINFNFSH